MKIKSVSISGFRNFKEVIVPFTEKTLIIGANDIGKTNLIYALRLLLDRTLSDADLEPLDSDFYAHEDSDKFSIRIEFVEVNDDCVLSRMKDSVGEDATLCLEYRAYKDPATRKTSYELFAGYDVEHLNKIESRFYLRVLNLKFIGSKRDLFSYIRTERRNLLRDAKSNRSTDDITQDTTLLTEIETELANINDRVTDLSYVSKATDSVNAELGALSFHNLAQQVVFDTGASDPTEFVDNLKLVSRVNDKSLMIGGDGRNNQIHLALWAARNRINLDVETDVTEITFFCIEEPEAHLHPHQQRKLARYLSESLNAQVIITTHSPQIVSEFPPTTIIRLFNNSPDTLAAGNGIDPFVEGAFIDFGYRLNAISAEVFFSSVVLLVEGFSEELFYKALARQLKDDIDLDRLNISIQMVDGVGFQVYASLLNSLNIPFVVRTDNDIFKVPNKERKRFAGIQRALAIYNSFRERNDVLDGLSSQLGFLEFDGDAIPAENAQIADEFRSALEPTGIFVAEKDLEHDVFTVLSDELKAYFKDKDDEQIVAEMQKKKATFMFSFLRDHATALGNLREESITSPLYRCRTIVEALR